MACDCCLCILPIQPNIGPLAEYNLWPPLSLHAPFIPSLFLVTMQSTQETKNSISSSVYGIQQLFRDFEKQCHILTTPATEGTLYHHPPHNHHFQLVDLIKRLFQKKRSMHSVLSTSTTHDKSSCSTLTPFDRYALSLRQRC